MNASYNKENQLTGKDLAKKVDKLLKDQASMSEQLKTINEKTQADL